MISNSITSPEPDPFLKQNPKSPPLTTFTLEGLDSLIGQCCLTHRCSVVADNIDATELLLGAFNQGCNTLGLAGVDGPHFYVMALRPQLRRKLMSSMPSQSSLSNSHFPPRSFPHPPTFSPPPSQSPSSTNPSSPHPLSLLGYLPPRSNNGHRPWRPPDAMPPTIEPVPSGITPDTRLQTPTSFLLHHHLVSPLHYHDGAALFSGISEPQG